MAPQQAQVASPIKAVPKLDRRRSARTPIQGSQSVQGFLISATLSYPVRLRDLSTSGAGFFLDRSVPVGTKLLLEITNKAQLFTCRRAVRVAHSTLMQQGIHLIGCEFAAPLTYPQVFALRCR
jgi:hypothetical protein